MQELFASGDTHVNYGGSLELPFCIGSIVVPLEIEKKEPILLAQWLANPLRDQTEEHHQQTAVEGSGGGGGDASGEGAEARRKRLPSEKKESTRIKHAHEEKYLKKRGAVSHAAEASRRHTHRRICYLRDGSELSLDSFYRWFYYYYTKNRLTSNEEREEVALSAKRKKVDTLSTSTSQDDAAAKQIAAENDDANRTEEEQLFAQFLQLYNNHSHLHGEQPSAHAPPNLSNPSPLYAIIESVEFSVPSSFPTPHRVLRHPPFFIEDLTWAEHPVDVKINFLSLLRVKPFVFTHYVKWHPRVAGTPTLLQSQYYGVMRQEVVDEVEEERRLHSGEDDTADRNDEDGEEKGAVRTPTAVRRRMERLCRRIVVNEKRDSIRFFHPTELLSRAVAHVYERSTYHAETELLEALYQQSVFQPPSPDSPSAEESTEEHKAQAACVPLHYLVGGSLDDSVAAMEHFAEACVAISSAPPEEPARTSAAAAAAVYASPSAWDFPFEFVLHWHHQKQQQLQPPHAPPLRESPLGVAPHGLNTVPFEFAAHTRSEAALLSVLQTLQAEQVELLGACEEQLGAMAARVAEVQATMQTLFAECQAEVGKSS